MDRANFVRGYAERSGLVGKAVITDFGILGDGWAYVAMPCDCGEDVCEGWQMANPREFLSLQLPPVRQELLAIARPPSSS